MIDFNFDYYIPSSIDEAVKLFEELKETDLRPLYYAGGTEIITFARKNDIDTRAVIDLKGIPECNAFYTNEDKIVIGSVVTLTAIEEAKLFPLITETSGFPADHTARNKITYGGNICGRIIYKEAVLTPLVIDAQIVTAGKEGIRIVPLNGAFKEKLQLQEGEFLVQIIMDKGYGSLPYYTVKRTKSSKASYPLLSFAAVKKDDKIRFAISGACDFPFRSHEMEERLNMTFLTREKRIEEALKHLPAPLMSNLESGREYREFVLRNTLMTSLKVLEGK